MAEAIANKSPKIKVPGALSSMFTRAIRARKKAAEWFKESHSDRILDESNQTHAHFVDILQRAGDILRPLVKERSPQEPKPKERPQNSKLASMQEMRNAFSSLAVENDDVPDNPEEESEEAAQLEEPLDSLPPVEPVEIQQDESETDAEFFFAIQSFIMNLQELRDIVQETWFAYKDEKADIVKASLIANTAIDLVRHAEAEFDLLLKRPKKYPQKEFPVWGKSS
jgi:hypothetical protein